MYPISSRLGSDHTAQTDAAFSFVMLTLVAVAAFLPHVPFSMSSSSPEGFIYLGINFWWRFPLIKQKIEMSATVVDITVKLQFIDCCVCSGLGQSLIGLY